MSKQLPRNVRIANEKEWVKFVIQSRNAYYDDDPLYSPKAIKDLLSNKKDFSNYFNWADKFYGCPEEFPCIASACVVLTWLFKPYLSFEYSHREYIDEALKEAQEMMDKLNNNESL